MSKSSTIEQTHDNSWKKRADQLKQNIDLLAEQLKYEQALALAGQLSALVEQHKEENPIIYVVFLASFYWNISEYDKAEPLYQQALEIFRTALGEQHPDVATCLHHLAAVYFKLKDYAKAEPLYQQALEVRRATLGEQHPDVAISLHHLAVLYYEMGNYPQAEPLYRQALEILRTTLGEQHPDVATCLNNLAALYYKERNYPQAESLYQQALEVRRMTLGEQHPDVAASLNNLANLYCEMSDDVTAEPLYWQALDIWQATLGEQDPNVATCLNCLATLYHDRSNYPQAESLYRQALKLRRAMLGEQHPDVATCLNNLAALYYGTGNYPQAEPLYQQALEVRRMVLGEQHPDVATCLHNLAALYAKLRDYSQAESLYRQALDIWQATLGEQHPRVATCLNNLAILYTRTDRHNDAWSFVQRSTAIDDHLIQQIFSIGSERQRMAYLDNIRAEFEHFLSLVLQHFPADAEKVLAAFDLVLRRKAIGTEVLAAQHDTLMRNRYPTLIAELHIYTDLRRQIALKSMEGPGSEGLAAYQQTLNAWNTSKEQMEAQLARKIPEMNLQLQFRRPNREAVATGLPSGSALVEFVRVNVFDFKTMLAKGEKRYVAFVLLATKPNTVQMIDLGEAEHIDQLIKAFRTSITGENERQLDRQLTLGTGKSTNVASENAGCILRAIIFDPLLDALKGYKRFFLAPDGDLSRLPFEVLPTNHGKRLIDEYHISYLGVGRDVLRFNMSSIRQPGNSLILADPDFNLDQSSVMPSPQTASLSQRNYSRDLDRSELYFSSLPNTRSEGEQIAAQLKVEPFLKGSVLKSTILTASSPYILHLATHGFFLEDQQNEPETTLFTPDMIVKDKMHWMSKQENPLLRSGLALAGANTWLRRGELPPEAGNGLLTAEDISGLDLSDTELIVLSACETGLGKIHVGEGVFGLRRVFTIAGARRLVMSLWKVSDEQTQELMVDFYTRLAQGRPCNEALQEAQLALKAKYPHPRHWGSFICQGDPGPLREHKLDESTSFNDIIDL